MRFAEPADRAIHAGITNLRDEIRTMTVGTVKWFNPVKGYGFIQPDNGDKDAFVHISAVESAGLDGLREGQKVEFELISDDRGRSSAENLSLVE